MNRYLQISLLTVGTLVSNFWIAVSDASAIALVFRGNTRQELIDASKTNVNQLLKVEGRAGAPGTADYEIGIGPEGAQTGLTGQLQVEWANGTFYDWSLEWNTIDNIATFRVFDDGVSVGSPLTNMFTGPGPDQYNAFGLLAWANTDNLVSPNTTLSLIVDSVNDAPNFTVDNVVPPDRSIAISATSPATPGQMLNEVYYALDPDDILFSFFPEITTMTGRFQMSWDGENPQTNFARSRVGFQLILFDPPVEVPSTPEPMGVVSSLMVLGVLSVIRKRNG